MPPQMMRKFKCSAAMETDEILFVAVNRFHVYVKVNSLKKLLFALLAAVGSDIEVGRVNMTLQVASIIKSSVAQLTKPSGST